MCTIASVCACSGSGSAGNADAIPQAGPTTVVAGGAVSEGPGTTPPPQGVTALPTATAGAHVTVSSSPGAHPTATAIAAPSTAPSTSSNGVQFGGYTGGETTYVPHESGDGFEYSEEVALTFPRAESNDFAYTITGNDGSTPPSSVYWVNYGKTAAITVRKVPGVVYTVKVARPVSYSATFTTQANPTIPNPILSTQGQAYRYGVLDHPFPQFLSGPQGARQIQLICNAHVRFVRIDYDASLLLDNASTVYSAPDFSQEDAIMDQLAKCGVTELPGILQYAAGNPLTDSQSESLPMRFASSTAQGNTAHIPGYADLAKDIVQHIMTKYPQITRVELFNEPNDGGGWGNFPVNGNYGDVDTSGAQAAVYMKAAYSAIKSVDPKMTVVGPALGDGGTTGGTDPRTFLQTLLNNGCGPGTCYDVLSVHNYDWENPTVAKNSLYEGRWNIYQTLQQVLAQNGHPGVHVMLTEWGFSTIMQPDGFDPSVQAQYVALGLNLMLADPTVDGIVYVNLYNPATDFWGYTSLVNQQYQPKPAYQVLEKFASY